MSLPLCAQVTGALARSRVIMMIIAISAVIIRLFHGLHGSDEVRAAGDALGVHKKGSPTSRGIVMRELGRQAGRGEVPWLGRRRGAGGQV